MGSTGQFERARRLAPYEETLPYLSNPSQIVCIRGCDGRQGYLSHLSTMAPSSMIESLVRCWAMSELKNSIDVQGTISSELGIKYGCTANEIAIAPLICSALITLVQPFKRRFSHSMPACSRMREPEEMAHSVGFLCEENPRWISGVCGGGQWCILYGVVWISFKSSSYINTSNLYLA
jgi:hypothetical protein